MSNIPKIKIGFNKEWETRNWYDTIYSRARFGLKNGSDKWNLGEIPANLPQLLKNISDKNKAIAFIKEKIDDEITKPEITKLIEDSITRAKERWNQIDQDFFFVLSKMLDISISRFEPEYNAYFTLSSRAPFGKNSFMFNKYLNFGDLAMHEIMHIEFLKQYSQFCQEKGLNDEKIDHLKEILTVLLNEDAHNLLSKPDPGYTKHQELRPKILEIYRKIGGKNNNFRNFLDEIIPLIKSANF